MGLLRFGRDFITAVITDSIKVVFAVAAGFAGVGLASCPKAEKLNNKIKVAVFI